MFAIWQLYFYFSRFPPILILWLSTIIWHFLKNFCICYFVYPADFLLPSSNSIDGQPRLTEKGKSFWNGVTWPWLCERVIDYGWNTGHRKNDCNVIKIIKKTEKMKLRKANVWDRKPQRYPKYAKMLAMMTANKIHNCAKGRIVTSIPDCLFHVHDLEPT